jgi:rRNA maturation endonuclease Nob1
MPTFYDDNYGTWEDMYDEDNIEFYQRTQATNVRKKCQGCGRIVRIQPQYGYCNSCADKRERGEDF